MDTVIATLMNDTIDAPWADGIDINLASDAYFGSRTASLSIYDKTGEVTALAEGARKHYNLDERNHILDRAARMYLAYLLDTNDDLPDLRAEYGVTAAIPPREWMFSFEREQVDPVDGDFEPGPLVPKTVSTVKEMVVDLVEHPASGYETQSQFIIDALQWLTKQDE